MRVEGVGRDALQGDVRFADAPPHSARVHFEDRAIIAKPRPMAVCARSMPDMNHIPDAAMTLAVVALFAEGTTRLTNIGSWRVKETDRIAQWPRNCATLARPSRRDRLIAVTPPAVLSRPMLRSTPMTITALPCAFSGKSGRGVPVRINDPKCVNKTFPVTSIR